MYILAIETTGAYASVALAKEGKILARVRGHDRFSHLQNLTPQIQQVINEALGNDDKSLSSINDVDALAVSAGPGSFTGLRIGISTVRAISQITGKPCVSVSSLEALAMRASEADGKTAENEEALTNALICPILDARRSQVYGGGYYIRDGFPVEIIKAGPYTIEEFMELIKDYEKAYFIGDGIDAYEDKIRELRAEGIAFAPEETRYQKAETVALLAEKMVNEGRICSFDKLQPDYMRLPEAERARMAREAEKNKTAGEKSNG